MKYFLSNLSFLNKNFRIIIFFLTWKNFLELFIYKISWFFTFFISQKNDIKATNVNDKIWCCCRGNFKNLSKTIDENTGLYCLKKLNQKNIYSFSLINKIILLNLYMEIFFVYFLKILWMKNISEHWNLIATKLC